MGEVEWGIGVGMEWGRYSGWRLWALSWPVRVRVTVRVWVRVWGGVCPHTHICTNHYKGYGMLHQRDVRKGSDLQR